VAVPVRIVVVNATGECSGAELVLLALVDRAVARGSEVVVVCPAGPLVERLPAGVRHVPIAPLVPRRRRAGRHVGALASLARSWLAARATLTPEVRRGDTHVVVNSLWALPVVRASGPRRPYVWLVHDTLHTRRQRAVVRLGARGHRRQRVRTVAVSEAAAAPLRDLGLDVAVCPNGVRWPVAAIDPDAVHDPPIVGMLGLLTPWKGQAVLLEAAAGLPGVHVQLAGGEFAGDAGYVGKLSERAAAPDLAGRVELLGPVAALPVLATWDVFVSASTSPEAGPLAVLEAMSVGLPVIVTDHGGGPEYVGDAGVVVPPGDVEALRAAIAALLADPEERRRLGARARARIAARYDDAVTGERLFEAVMTQ
jgi:glycosyltransferase involved in cell wall biosynthesis